MILHKLEHIFNASMMLEAQILDFCNTLYQNNVHESPPTPN